MCEDTKELYYVALANSNGQGRRWTTFLSYPSQATAEQTGFTAVGYGHETSEDADAEVRMLNSSMFRIES